MSFKWKGCVSIWERKLLGAKIASCCCYTAAVLPFLFSFAVFSSDVFCFFFEIPFHMKKVLPKACSCQRNHMSFYTLSQYFHTLPKAVSYTAEGSLIHCRRQSHTLPNAVSHKAGSARRLPPTGRTPLTLSPDAFARG